MRELHPIIAIKLSKLDQLESKLEFKIGNNYWSFFCNLINIKLIKNQPETIKPLIAKFFNSKGNIANYIFNLKNTAHHIFQYISCTYDKKLVNDLLMFCESAKVGSNDQIEEFNNLAIYIKALVHIFNFEFNSAAKKINSIFNYNFKFKEIGENTTLIKALLFNLRNFSDSQKPLIESEIESKLDGNNKKITLAILNNQVIKFNENWPKKILNSFFHRSIYALYLLNKKDPYAIEVINTIDMPNLGIAYMQPFIKKLKEKYSINHV